jgi:hypothetical protein
VITKYEDFSTSIHLTSFREKTIDLALFVVAVSETCVYPVDTIEGDFYW